MRFISWLLCTGISQRRRTVSLVSRLKGVSFLQHLRHFSVVPIPHPVGKARQPPDMPISLTDPVPHVSFEVCQISLRVYDFLTDVLQLHVAYLSSRSAYLRGLFAGENPLDLIASFPIKVPTSRLPHLCPSSELPTLYLPVPDPTSFHLLVHWMYFGRTQYIGDCLDRGIVRLEGIRQNVVYLSLPDSTIGKFLRCWEHDSFYEDISDDDGSFCGEEEEDEDEDKC